MKEEELLSTAIELYHNKGKELNAIKAFKTLLDEYPENVKGWTHLSAMQIQITDYDGAIESINRAIEIEPENSRIIRQKCTFLQMLLRYPSEGQMYFNEQTKEAYEIKYFNTRTELRINLGQSLRKVIKLEKENKKVSYDFKCKLALNEQKLGKYENAIKILNSLKNEIPENFNSNRKEKQLKNIEQGITNNLIGLKKYEEAIQRLEEIKSTMEDDYFLGIQLSELYIKNGEKEKGENILIEILETNQNRLNQAPKLWQIYRKFEILKKLNKSKEMDEIYEDFNLIKDHNDLVVSRRKEIEEKIKNFREQSAKRT